MKLKKFSDYLSYSLKENSMFEKRVVFASGDKYAISIFEEFKNSNGESKPIITWGKPTLALNEHSTNVFGKACPGAVKIFEDLQGSDFVPKSTKKRNDVKSLKFPISAWIGEKKAHFKTYGKFKKSEQRFDLFSEQLPALSTFEVISFKGEPIHLQEKINGVSFDVDLPRFADYDKVCEITRSIYEKYGADLFCATVIKGNSNLCLEEISTQSDLSPSQQVKIYESVYESYYGAPLSKWFKKTLFESYVEPYFSKKRFDAQLLRPKYSIDFEKYR